MSKYIRFDWAMKKLLRNKANAVVLEGFISTLLDKDITINKFLESESNQEDETDKQNRADLLAEDSEGNKYIIEVQNSNVFSYFQRMLFGTSKLITEYIQKGDSYEKIQKVYSINIVYFNLGQGSDYIYYGSTEFRGVHNNDILSLSPFQMQKFNCDTVSKIFPEYYILKVDSFNKEATSKLEELISFLKSGDIPEYPKAKGLKEAKEIMLYENMSDEEKRIYDKRLDAIAIMNDTIVTTRGEAILEGRAEGMELGLAEGIERGLAKGLEKGRVEGRAEGRAEGERKKAFDIAKKMLQCNIAIETIRETTGLTKEEISGIQ